MVFTERQKRSNFYPEVGIYVYISLLFSILLTRRAISKRIFLVVFLPSSIELHSLTKIYVRAFGGSGHPEESISGNSSGTRNPANTFFRYQTRLS